MNRLFSYTFIVIYCLTLATSCQQEDKREKLPDANDKVYSVSTAKVEERKIPDVIEKPGTFIPSESIEIKSELNGKVVELPIREGQTVVQGEVLAKIEDERLPFILEQQRAELREAEAQLEYDRRLAEGEEIEPIEEENGNEIAGDNTEEESEVEEPEEFDEEILEEETDPLARARRLAQLHRRARQRSRLDEFRQALVSQKRDTEQQIELNESKQNLSQARIERIRANIALSEKQIAGGEITAPFDGFISELTVTEGSLVQANESVLKMININPIQLSVQIPKDEISKVEKSTPVKIRIPDIDEKILAGQIAYIGAMLSQGNKSVEVRVRIANPQEKIKVNMEAIAQFSLSRSLHDALLVPENTVILSKNQKYLYTVEGQVAERRKVETGASFEGMIEITKGVEIGEEVVTNGAKELKERQEFIKINSTGDI